MRQSIAVPTARVTICDACVRLRSDILADEEPAAPTVSYGADADESYALRNAQNRKRLIDLVARLDDGALAHPLAGG